MSKSKKQTKQKKLSIRYGTGELYGFDFASLPADRIRALANAPFKSQPCPFRGGGFMCNKKAGYQAVGAALSAHASPTSRQPITPRTAQEAHVQLYRSY
jgi:hypothetical protein